MGEGRIGEGEFEFLRTPPSVARTAPDTFPGYQSLPSPPPPPPSFGPRASGPQSPPVRAPAPPSGHAGRYSGAERFVSGGPGPGSWPPVTAFGFGQEQAAYGEGGPGFEDERESGHGDDVASPTSTSSLPYASPTPPFTAFGRPQAAGPGPTTEYGSSTTMDATATTTATRLSTWDFPLARQASTRITAQTYYERNMPEEQRRPHPAPASLRIPEFQSQSRPQPQPRAPSLSPEVPEIGIMPATPEPRLGGLELSMGSSESVGETFITQAPVDSSQGPFVHPLPDSSSPAPGAPFAYGWENSITDGGSHPAATFFPLRTQPLRPWQRDMNEDEVEMPRSAPVWSGSRNEFERQLDVVEARRIANVRMAVPGEGSSMTGGLDPGVGRPRSRTYPSGETENVHHPVDPPDDLGAWARFPPRTVEANDSELDLGAWARQPPPTRPQRQTQAPPRSSPIVARRTTASSSSAPPITFTTVVVSDSDSDQEPEHGIVIEEPIEEQPVQPQLERRTSISLPDPEAESESAPQPHVNSDLETFRNSLRLTENGEYLLPPDPSFPARRTSSFTAGQVEAREQRDDIQALGHRRSRSDAALDTQDSLLFRVGISAFDFWLRSMSDCVVICIAERTFAFGPKLVLASSAPPARGSCGLGFGTV